MMNFTGNIRKFFLGTVLVRNEEAVVLYGAVVHAVWRVYKIKKAEKLKLYEAVVDALFEEQDLV